MRSTAISFVLLATAAGVRFVIQQAVNARLRFSLDSWWARLVNHAGGTIVMAGVALRGPDHWLACSVRFFSSSASCWSDADEA
jgi:uncharacterized membrane protein YdcZ (DUF606 family)